jgi:hypothetical protein
MIEPYNVNENKTRALHVGHKSSMLISIGRMELNIANTVLEVENPHFTIALFEDLLKIPLKGSFKNEIEEVLEN